MRAALFDVGDTLVENWSADLSRRTRAALVSNFGEREWYDAWLAARIEPEDAAVLEQTTLDWYRRWFEAQGVDLAGLPLEHLRAAMVLPLDEVSTPVPGAFDAVRWCHGRGLRVVLVTNTLSRGDAEVVEDWRRFGISHLICGVVSSHSVGWRKPHAAIFERALALADCRAEDAFMVGDNLAADVGGAKRLGLRAVWRRRPGAAFDDYDGPPPDAIVDDLTSLPAVVTPWLSA